MKFSDYEAKMSDPGKTSAFDAGSGMLLGLRPTGAIYSAPASLLEMAEMEVSKARENVRIAEVRLAGAEERLEIVKRRVAP